MMADEIRPTGVYSDKQIRAAIAAGQIICRPFIAKNVNPASLNVTLGKWYYRTEKSLGGDFYNPFDPEDVSNYFVGPKEAVVHKEWAKRNKRHLFKGIPPEWPIIVLAPQERILAHTNEFVGIKAPGAVMMLARSTWGRNGLSVCFDAGWGDPDYVNRWTMEIYNLNHHHSLVLPVGEGVAQLIFMQTGAVESKYGLHTGKYQSHGADDIDKIIAAWKPQMMLPRAYKDERNWVDPYRDQPTG